MGPQTFYNQGVRRDAADTSLKQQSDYTTNAYDAYAQMLASKGQQAKADALPVEGTGLAKLETAISNSPQLQSGLLAAGLSLMFGGDAETAVTAGVGAASNVNLQDKQAEESKKAEFLGSAKQQSQMEHSYSQADLFGRQPDDFGLQAEKLRVGFGGQQLANDLLKFMVGQGTEMQRLRVQMGLEPGLLPTEVASVGGAMGELARQSNATVPGLNAQGFTGSTKQVRLSGDQKAYFKALYDQAVAAKWPRAQIDDLMFQKLAERGLTRAVPVNDAFYADLSKAAKAPTTPALPGTPSAAAPGTGQPKPTTPPAGASSKPGGKYLGKDLNKMSVEELTRLEYAAADNPNWIGPSLKEIQAAKQAKQTSAAGLYKALGGNEQKTLDAYFNTFK